MKRAHTPQPNRDRTPHQASTAPRPHTLGDELTTSILLQIKDAVPRIETELQHLRRLAEATRKDVNDLKTWRSLVLGGVAVLGLLFGLYRAMAGSVHVTYGHPSPTAALPSVVPSGAP
ncbi:hypothetical protein VI08_01000 [Luteibacter yeojuensis]|uniref:Uncharacterized protein n=1 Tax=Luteibacter yeojuensis TaxID=345309 RepID=A0A0F3L0Z6_9GAMM|nr:hypothetical protein VI08_01000 [Luteibacter yeojuensis]